MKFGISLDLSSNHILDIMSGICLLVKAFCKHLLCLAVCEFLFIENFKSDDGSLGEIIWRNSCRYPLCLIVLPIPRKVSPAQQNPCLLELPLQAHNWAHRQRQKYIYAPVLAPTNNIFLIMQPGSLYSCSPTRSLSMCLVIYIHLLKCSLFLSHAVITAQLQSGFTNSKDILQLSSWDFILCSNSSK